MQNTNNLTANFNGLISTVELLNEKFIILSTEDFYTRNVFITKKILFVISELNFYVTSAFNLLERPIDLLKQLQTAQIQTQFLLVLLKPLIDKSQNCVLILRDINQITIDIDIKIENIILAIP